MPSLSSLAGGLLLLHAAYSCLHFRMLQYENSATTTPKDVYLEAGLGWVLLLVGELTQRALYPIQGGKRIQLVAPQYESRDFDIYSTRAKGL